MSEEFETTIKRIAEQFPYPATPLARPTAQPMSQRRWQRAAVLLLLIGLCGLFIPDIRAAVLKFLQIGIVRIDLEGTSETGQPLYLDDVSGETTLEAARSQVAFPLLIPPDDLPDRVFVQDSLIIFVWLVDGQVDRALYQIPNYDWFVMKQTPIVSHVRIGSADALWVDLQHPVQFIQSGEVHTELTHFVTGHVLVWTVDEMTYRLETRLSLDDARRFAESLVVMPESKEK